MPKVKEKTTERDTETYLCSGASESLMKARARENRVRGFRLNINRKENNRTDRLGYGLIWIKLSTISSICQVMWTRDEVNRF